MLEFPVGRWPYPPAFAKTSNIALNRDRRKRRPLEIEANVAFHSNRIGRRLSPREPAEGSTAGFFQFFQELVPC